MGNIYIFSLIFGLLASILIFPFTATQPAAKAKTAKKDYKPGLGILAGIAIIFTIVIFIYYYITNLDRNFSSFWPFLILISALGALLARGKEQLVKSLIFIAGLLLGFYFMTAFLFNADEKFETAKMEQQTEIKTFDETKTPASVPPQFARNKMRKAFGQVPNTSYYELGSLQIQKINNEYVYIAPVEFSGFFKWFNGDKTPGYFTLSATDSTANPKFVKSDMIYTPSSYFGKSIERHIRMQYPDYIFKGDVQLEIDEEGKPYYIRSYGNFISARNGFSVKGIVVVDPLSGKTEDFLLKDAPAFIDGSVSPEVVSLQNSYFGKYIHGFWNSVFGKTDVKLPSDEGTEANVTPIFDENGAMYYFTDFTSPKEGVDSMLGYSLTDSRSGDATYYTGNLEESYMDSEGALQIIEKKFIEKKWKGRMPVLYNFYGEASWLTPVLDSNGFLQNYFIVSAANPEISVYGTTPNDALRQYKLALQRGGGGVDGSSQAEEKQVSGTVLRVYKEKSGDYTAVSFLLDNRQNFILSSERLPLAIYLKEGDKVVITYLDTGETFLTVKEMRIEGLE
ncbi:hypothetical protein AM500_01430 [Bacillus sp. FJAT-18017]|uniref:tripartite tricarboxylate transporter TctB family protein n=1 Tax=Bacillus sp. FJAT-18017 TaxID=1705566 RepID=UPI0006AE45F6|nr:tripartite tricarboxylate transporter TctB family protein [Bacillus sp. FJAT-18017]ALC88601.1 hypothetical protein AM500_01430 [Bacillus sp. FJAT-18017]